MPKRKVIIKWHPGAEELVGLPYLRAGDTVKLEGIGFAFKGAYYVASSTHTINDGQYVTRFEAERSVADSAPCRASGHRHRSHDLAVGVVKESNRKAHQVEVQLPWLTEKKKNIWAHVPEKSASSKRGSWFMPEEGDEVLVVFAPGESRSPIVVGFLWQGEDEPPPVSASP